MPYPPNPWAHQHRLRREIPREWRDRILDYSPDANVFSQRLLDAPYNMPGNVINADELMRRRGRAQHGIENPQYPYSVEGQGGVPMPPPPLSQYLQDQARRREAPEQWFADQMMERGPPNFRAMPPWETEVIPY